MRPESRREQLLTQSVGTELVIYDERTHEAHHLSQTAAHVWHLADGERGLPDLASALREKVAMTTDGDVASLDTETSLELTRLALWELDRAGLLARALPDLTVLGEPITRRQMLGVTAALLPVVASIVAPTPAMAATCLGASASASPTSVIPNGGQVIVNITGLCGWQATSQASHITPAGPTSGSGTGIVTFNVAANTSSTARTGVIAVTFPGNTNFFNLTISQNGGAETPVAPSVPTLATVSPNQGIQGATVPVTLTGTNFVSGTTSVAVAGGGVSVTNISVGSSTSLTATLVIDPAASIGARGVTVTTSAGTSTPATFTVNPPPPVAVISSPTGSVSVNTPVTFNGSGSTGSISTYSWNFGDSTTGSGPIVTHTYPLTLVPPSSSTTVTVTLTVSGPGGSNTATKQITVTRSY